MIAEESLQQYARQWGATCVPFSERAGGEAAFCVTEQASRAMALLNQSAALRTVMLLSGENGVGKSALLGRWMRQLDTRLYFPVAVTQATLTGTALLAFFAGKLGKSARLSRNSNLRLIEEALTELGKVTPALILDEAQTYAPDALEEVRLLLGLNLGEEPAFALVLAGDQYLPKTLQLRSHRALYSRIAVHCQLQALTRREIDAYVEHGFRSASITRQSVEAGAMELIAAACGGIPRTINLIVRRAWIEASAQKANVISAEHVQRALDLVPVALEKAL